MKLLNIFSIVLIVVLLGLAANSYLREQQFLQDATPITGTVADLDMSDNSFCPVIEFTTREGKNVRFYGNVCSNPPAYDIGDQVDLLYDAPDVNTVQMKNSFFSKYGSAAIFAFIGGLFLAIYMFVVIANLRDAARARG